MQTNKTHWPSLLILITLVLSALSLLLLAAVMGGVSVYDLFMDKASPAAEMITSVVFGFEALVILLCGWLVLQKTMRREQADSPFRFPFSEWQTPVILGFIFFIIVIGGVIAYQEVAWLSWLVLPVLTVLVITPPVWLLLGIGSKGIEFGPRWRVFGIFGLGMTLSPFIMIVLKIILLALMFLVAIIFIAMQPDLLQQMMDLSLLMKGQTDQDVILKLLSPYIVKPGVIAGALIYIAVFVPMVEELFKPLAVWLFAKSIETPAQGFALGLLSGAAFALVESLNASSDGSTTWPIIVSVRAGTTLLHVTASGLVGWGIASAFREKKILRLFAAYFSAVMIHGLWNACALGAGLSSIGNLIGKPEWVFAIVPAAVGGMFTLGVGMFIILIASNRKLRQNSQPPSLPDQQGSESAGVQ